MLPHSNRGESSATCRLDLSGSLWLLSLRAQERVCPPHERPDREGGFGKREMLRESIREAAARTVLIIPSRFPLRCPRA